MKTLKLIFEFFTNNKITAIIISIIYIFVLFIANNSFGMYRYIVYTEDIFKTTETTDSFYCMPNLVTAEMVNSSSMDPWGDYINNVENNARKYKAYVSFTKVKYFNSDFNGVRIKSYIYTTDMIEKYQFNLKNGSWNNMQEQSSDYFNVIVSGIYFDYLNIGDIAEIELPNYFDSSTKKIKIKVAGKLAEPYTVPSFNTSGTDINTYDLYQKLENGLIFVESSRLTKVFKSVNNCPLTAENFIASYKSNSSEAERKEYLNYFTKQFRVTDYDNIIKNTDKVIALSFRRRLPTPLFMLSIMTVALISISVLFVNKKLREHSIYYLCGCNRRKSYFIISCAIGLMGLLGGLLNILFIVNYDFLTSNGIINMSDGLIYDGQTVLFTLLYALAVSAVSVIISILVFRKSSPIEIYRKYES